MKRQLSCLLVILTVACGTIFRGASRVTRTQQGHEGQDDRNLGALTSAVNTAQPPAHYRPWPHRFKLKEGEQNRAGYSHFKESHPRHPLAPNSIDREAQSTVVFIFASACLVTVLSCLVISYVLYDYAEWVKVVVLAGLGLLPFVLLGLWAQFVFWRHWSHPMRQSFAGDRWQCTGMVYYLLLYPVLIGAVFAVGLIRLAQGFISTKDLQKVPLIQCNLPNWLFWALLLAAGAVGLYGVVLAFFSGHNSSFCVPEVWWTTMLLAVPSVAGVAIATLVALLLYCGLILTNSLWLSDFVNSWGDADVRAASQPRRLKPSHRSKAVRVPATTGSSVLAGWPAMDRLKMSRTEPGAPLVQNVGLPLPVRFDSSTDYLTRGSCASASIQPAILESSLTHGHEQEASLKFQRSMLCGRREEGLPSRVEKVDCAPPLERPISAPPPSIAVSRFASVGAEDPTACLRTQREFESSLYGGVFPPLEPLAGPLIARSAPGTAFISTMSAPPQLACGGVPSAGYRSSQ